MSKVVKGAAWIALAVVQALFAGFVLSVLWGWFIVPKFSGAPVLDYRSAVGVNMTVTFFFHGLHFALPSSKDEEKDPIGESIVRSLALICVFYPLALLFAFVWHEVL